MLGKRVLITGGAGFIGSHLATRLCAEGGGVLVLDNLATGLKANLSETAGAGRLQFVEGDIRDTGLAAKLIQDCDAVVHLAAMASVPDTIKQPVESHEINASATLRLLEAARQAGLKRFVFASSAAVYGNSNPLPQSETMPVEPLSPYALQKQNGERHAQLYWQLYNFPAVALRFFNVFGPRQRPDSPYSGVISRFAAAFQAGRSPVIYGDGRQSRDFVFVSNVVDAILLALIRPVDAVGGEVFNVGTGASISLLDLAAEFARLSGSSLPVDHQPARAGEVRDSRADLSRSKARLKYQPTVSWQEGLRETWSFFEASTR